MRPVFRYFALFSVGLRLQTEKTPVSPEDRARETAREGGLHPQLGRNGEDCSDGIAEELHTTTVCMTESELGSYVVESIK